MEPLELVNHLATALDDKQGRDIVIIDVENLVGYTAYFVIASGRSERQVQALIQSVRTSNIKFLGYSHVDRGSSPLFSSGGNSPWKGHCKPIGA